MGILPWIEFDELVARSEDFLRTHYPSMGIPVPIEEIVDLKLGIDIVPTPNMLARFGIDAFLTRDQSQIRVDEDVYRYAGSRFRLRTKSRTSF